MTKATAQTFTDHMELLFGVGTCAAMTDGQLLERFLAGQDEAAELAFEALVARHGPMIMRVCRNALDDPHDVHDAFQAVFLVLARRAIAIRDRRSIGGWLYGVAVRVTARARVTAIRRRVHDRRTIGVARAVAADAPVSDDGSLAERNDHARVVHEELYQLPEKYRAPVVLCYLEGLTHEEAAARLSWPVGTVRSRLARARDRLRGRLGRRGMSAPASIGPLAHWLTAPAGGTPQLMATVSAASSAPIERAIVTSIVRAVAGQPIGRITAAASLPSASVLLAQGVLNMMVVKKWLVVACALLPLGAIVFGGGVFLARPSAAQNLSAGANAPSRDRPAAAQTPAATPPEVDPLLAAAVKRFDAQRAFYEEGRITLDRFIEGCYQLELAALKGARTEAERTAIKERHVTILREIEAREKAELEVGRGTLADLTEAVHRRLQAEAELRSRDDMASLIRRLGELEKKVEELEKRAR